jgi:voltage-gated potassium channel
VKDHVIVCGVGTTGRNISTELFHARVPVVAIDTNEHALLSLRNFYRAVRFDHVVGDATDDEVLERAGIQDARGVVATLPSDKDNLYIVVAARQGNPHARIVARVTELSHVDRLKRVGADSVVAMNYIGGQRIASEMLRPAFVRFLDAMLRDPRATYRLWEVTIGTGSMIANLTVREAAIRETFGVSVLAVGDGAASWHVNPRDTARLAPGTVLIVLASSEQVATLQLAAGAK